MRIQVNGDRLGAPVVVERRVERLGVQRQVPAAIERGEQVAHRPVHLVVDVLVHAEGVEEGVVAVILVDGHGLARAGVRFVDASNRVVS